VEGRVSLDFQWHLTNRCNLRCRHCYQEAFEDENLPELSLLAGRLLQGLEELDRQTVLNLTGGEPLLLGEELFRLLALLDRHPRVLEVMLITNALLIDRRTVAELASFAKLTTIKVSLEGMERVNDAIRGRGVFHRVLQALTHLVEAPFRVVLMVTLHQENLGEVPKIWRLARDLGLSGIIFERFVPEGRGKDMASAVLRKEEWQRFLEELCALCGFDIAALSLLSYRAFWVEFAEGVSLLGAPCSLGESFCLMPDGTVFPCRRLPIPLGNLLEEDLAVITTHPLLGKLKNRESLRGKCRQCSVAGCLGCRALAYAVLGDPFGEDPHCFLQEARISTTSLS